MKRRHSGVSRRLLEIVDWKKRAEQVNYCVTELACCCGVSTRTLRRHFAKVFNATPGGWLHELRMEKARELLMEGASVKETTAMLGYRQPSHFCQDFNKRYGYPPGEHVTRVLRSTNQSGNFNRNSRRCD